MTDRPQTTPTERLHAEIAAQLQERIDQQAMRALTGAFPTTSTAAAPGPTLTVEKLRQDMRRWDAMIRDARRSNVTIVVVDGHTGPMLHTQHPTDGRFIECSYLQAREVNATTPLRLVKVEAQDRAHFEVATPLHGLCCPLIPPPYEVSSYAE